MKCDTIVSLLEDYLKTKEEKWWFKINKDLGQYYFVLFFMRHVIFHNPYLNYVTNDRSWKWSDDPSKYLDFYNMTQNERHLESTPPIPIMIRHIIKTLKNNFVFPLNFKVNEIEYFFDIPDQQEIENIHNSWNKIICGKNGKRKCEIMYLKCNEWSGVFLDNLRRGYQKKFDTMEAESLFWSRMREILSHYKNMCLLQDYDNLVGYSIIYDHRRSFDCCSYAHDVLKKLFKKIDTEKLKYQTIILADTQDYFNFREHYAFNENSPFYTSSKKFPKLELLILKNIDARNLVVRDLFTIDSLNTYKKPLTVFGSGIEVDRR